jgi:hypothetical protein
LILGVLIGTAFLGSWPPLRIVMSSSMEPAIATGDVAVIRALSGPPEVGDVVVVPVPREIQDRYRYPAEVLHRVVEITPEGLVRTQGDNLSEPVPFGVPATSVQGTSVMVIPGLGKVFAFITSPFGLAWLFAGVVLFALVPFIRSQRDVVYAVEEYGHHLRSHTQVLKSMSEASQELSATVVELRRWMEAVPTVGIPDPVPGTSEPVTADGTGRPEDRPDEPLRNLSLLDPEAMPAGFLRREAPALYDDEMNPVVDPVPGRTTHPALLPPDWPRGPA